MQDVSCNEITALPQQIGQLKALRELNVRRNYLKVLPQGKKNKIGDVHYYYFLVYFCEEGSLSSHVCVCLIILLIILI